jgi:hypothetical protein
MRDQNPCPNAYPRIRAERAVRDFQHDTEHVLIGEEVLASIGPLFQPPRAMTIPPVKPALGAMMAV